VSKQCASLCFDIDRDSLSGEEIIMLRITRRRTRDDTVRFCDPCAQVSTSADRAERRYQDSRTATLLIHGRLG
jgi:hypothetical protein